MLRLWQTSTRCTIPLWNVYRNTEDFQRIRRAHTTPDANADDKLSKMARFKVFKEDNATIILDIEEERDRISSENEVINIDEERVSAFDQFNQKCGKTGVFDIDELVDVLKFNNCQDIFVCTVDAEFTWVGHMCVTTARSYRQMQAAATFVRKLYKIKRDARGWTPKVEGKDSKEWVALDLGNIALHIMAEDTRQRYDIETLWCVGSKFDMESNKVDPFTELINQHTYDLNSRNKLARNRFKYLPDTN